MMIVLRVEGRRWWCRCGRLFPWSGDIHSGHNSQHLFDPYSFSHLLHGVLFYAFLSLVARRLGIRARLVIALLLEAAWEILENSHWVIDRYRAATISQGYAGDTIFNSLGDFASCLLGFLLAARLPVRWSVAIVMIVEAGMLALYRDNLLLNVVMLVWPFEAVRNWQAAG